MESPSSGSRIGSDQMIKKITAGMKWEAKAIPPHQPEAMNCIGDETGVGVCIHEDGEDSERIGLVGGFGLDEGGEEGSGGVLALSGDEKAEEGVGMGEEMVGAEEVGHGGVGMEGEAEGGVEGGPVEEGEEGEGREGEGVEGEEGGDVGGGEGREDELEGGMEGGLVGVLDGLGERNEELRGSASRNGGDWMGKRGRGGGAWVEEEEGRAEGRETDCRRAEAKAEAEEEARHTLMTMTGATNSALVLVPYGNKP